MNNTINELKDSLRERIEKMTFALDNDQTLEIAFTIVIVAESEDSDHKFDTFLIGDGFRSDMHTDDLYSDVTFWSKSEVERRSKSRNLDTYEFRIATRRELIEAKLASAKELLETLERA